ncbi:MAG: Re/Si-specific NAD(P)(+) transhydrogenase subunit alpha [Gammaproteobacteria bacterium]|nr:Re/Si-specific NAD(P)(+) transhydrogenase subunit alpha [Gammaproteobacteria bacterium]
MPIRVAVPKETAAGERRVAMSADVVKRLTRLGVEVHIEAGAGASSYVPDADFGPDAKIATAARDLLVSADVVFKVQPPTLEEIAAMKEGTIVVGYLSPHRNPDVVKALRDAKIQAHAVELIPRISRAQSMDALSSQANIAGYKAVLMGASLTSKFFPMLTTAAGTIRPSKVLIIGAGVAGLQAIATARRLGAVVEAYDVRAATKEQCESLGAKFVDTGVAADGQGGYARELTDAEKAQQQEVLNKHIAAADVVVTTAAIPGRPSPKIISKAAVEAMKPGAVIVDLAAEGGGNCEVTVPGETITHGQVIVHGPLNVPSELSVHASEVYAKNLFNFIELMIKDGALNVDWDDEVIAESCVTANGEIRHEPTRKAVEAAQ